MYRPCFIAFGHTEGFCIGISQRKSPFPPLCTPLAGLTCFSEMLFLALVLSGLSVCLQSVAFLQLEFCHGEANFLSRIGRSEQSGRLETAVPLVGGFIATVIQWRHRSCFSGIRGYLLIQRSQLPSQPAVISPAQQLSLSSS